MDQKCLPSWRNPARYPTSHDADVFVHASHLMGGVHQRGGRRAAHRAAHRGAVGPERSGRSILKITSLCRCAGPQEAAFCVLRAMRHRGCYGISGRVFEHRVCMLSYSTLYSHMAQEIVPKDRNYTWTCSPFSRSFRFLAYVQTLFCS